LKLKEDKDSRLNWNFSKSRRNRIGIIRRKRQPDQENKIGKIIRVRSRKRSRKIKTIVTKMVQIIRRGGNRPQLKLQPKPPNLIRTHLPRRIELSPQLAIWRSESGRRC